MKKWYKSKTVKAGVATILTGIALYLTGDQTLQELAITGVGVIFTLLRFVTSESIE